MACCSEVATSTGVYAGLAFLLMLFGVTCGEPSRFPSGCHCSMLLQSALLGLAFRGLLIAGVALGVVKYGLVKGRSLGVSKGSPKSEDCETGM